MNWSASSNAERLPLNAISCFTCGGTDLEITDKHQRLMYTLKFTLEKKFCHNMYILEHIIDRQW